MNKSIEETYEQMFAKMKSRKKLESFVLFCYEHPELRFWQSLRAWAKVAYVFTSKDGKQLEDTFYIK